MNAPTVVRRSPISPFLGAPVRLFNIFSRAMLVPRVGAPEHEGCIGRDLATGHGGV